MTKQTIDGMIYLYHLNEKNNNIYNQEVVDRALDEFVRNPERENNVYKLTKSALGSSKKVISSRNEKQYIIKNEDQYSNFFESIESNNIDYEYIEQIDYINSIIANKKYAKILIVLLGGGTASDIAGLFGISNKHANTIISRARKYAQNKIVGEI